MKRNATIVLVALICTLCSCADSIPTYSDRDSKVDLKQYKTYAWMAPGDSVLNGPRKDKLFGAYIMYTADMELKQKGMTVDKSNPDAIFVFDTKVEEQTEYSQSPTLSVGVAYGGPGYYVGGSAPVAGGQITSTSVEAGELVINMYDTKTGKLIWKGGSKKTFKNSADIEQIIRTAVKSIFYRLPIKHKA